uniref:Uncharacterized protein n=1 Tax=Solanum lycopersicum TaxID=4081 RepID=K4CF21_SOLLC
MLSSTFGSYVRWSSVARGKFTFLSYVASLILIYYTPPRRVMCCSLSQDKCCSPSRFIPFLCSLLKVATRICAFLANLYVVITFACSVTALLLLFLTIASYNGTFPSESFLFGCAPKSSSLRIHSTLPFEAAKRKTVRPLLSDSLASMPFFSNWLNRRSSPLFAAAESIPFSGQDLSYVTICHVVGLWMLLSNKRNKPTIIRITYENSYLKNKLFFYIYIFLKKI